jgi:hypothetical protein
MALFASSTLAQAHQIWIEQPAGQAAVIRFGEFGENLREVSPGLLDNFGKPTATLISVKGERSADAAKSASGFTLPFKAGQGETIVAEDPAFPLRKFKRDDREVTSWYRPAARYATGFAAQEPRLTLDIVPAGQPGTFKVFFKGQPLPKARVAIVVQSGWAKEARSDDQGAVSFDLPWKGSYVLEASYIDRTPGERPGPNGAELYDGINYVTTPHVARADGVAPIPAGPVAAPNK